ncbi:MAG: DUF3040 domain-containing protein [Nocardioides sp.]
MPLSEEELRLLEQMERALVAEDPKFASTLRGTTLRHVARRRAILAGIALVGGMAILLAGAMSTNTIIGILGFVVMLISATIAVTALRSRPVGQVQHIAHPSGDFSVVEGGRSGRKQKSRRPKGSGSFTSRMEERWNRRREQNGGFDNYN